MDRLGGLFQTQPPLPPPPQPVPHPQTVERKEDIKGCLSGSHICSVSMTCAPGETIIWI